MALRKVRKALRISQESFGLISSRTYVSSLERALKTPTLGKVDELAAVLGVHPLTLLTLAYTEQQEPKKVCALLLLITKEIESVFGSAEVESR